MKRLRIEFSRRRDAGRAGLVLWLLLLTGGSALGGGLATGLVLIEKADARSAQASQLLNQRVSLQNAALERQEVISAEATEAINHAIRLLDYPSIELLTQLERHGRPDVEVLAVEMGPLRSSLRVMVKAAAAPLVLDYLDALKSEPGLRGMALLRQEPVEGSQISWRFILEATQTQTVPHVPASDSRRQGE